METERLEHPVGRAGWPNPGTFESFVAFTALAAHEDRGRGGGYMETASRLASFERALALIPRVLHWHHDVVVLLLKFKHQLDIIELVGDAKVDDRGGADKVHGQ